MYQGNSLNVFFILSLMFLSLFNLMVQDATVRRLSIEEGDPFWTPYDDTEQWTFPLEPSTESLEQPVTSASVIDSFKALSDDKSPPFSVFYNVFVPPRNETHPNLKYIRNAERIVEEQLDQVGKSYANSIPGKTLVVFFNTVGLDINVTGIESWCRTEHNMRCQHMQHYVQAFEDVTLSRVQEYCQVQPNHRVIYIHSKGSYHNRPANKPWRRALTFASTHRDCLEPPDNKCNVCGLQFFPVCSIEFPGNMWTASCDYVRRLLPPTGFDKQVERVYGEALKANMFTTNFKPYMDICTGTGRYAAEHWVGSHPSLQPCDISVPGDINHWFSHEGQAVEDLIFSSAPRRPLLSIEFQHGKFLIDYRHWMENETLRLREYLLLAGNLYRWFRLYDEAPPPDSWVWQFFPDGKRWLDAATRYGENATQRVLETLGPARPLRAIQDEIDNKVTAEA